MRRHRLTLRRRGDIRSLCLLDFPCSCGACRPPLRFEPLAPSPHAAHRIPVPPDVPRPHAPRDLADRRAARGLTMAKPAAKAKKDSKPKSKKPLKGFMLFSKEMRPKVKAEVTRRRSAAPSTGTLPHANGRD